LDILDILDIFGHFWTFLDISRNKKGMTFWCFSSKSQF
jgi:hypothetical protein